jgi:Leucine-rich repeat
MSATASNFATACTTYPLLVLVTLCHRHVLVAYHCLHACVCFTSLKRTEKLLSRQVLDLGWSRIACIENLELFTHLNELYLQHNDIAEIEGLECCTELRLLSLNNNRITRVENLQHLSKLVLLDLADNAINSCEPAALPRSLLMLDLRKNQCAEDAEQQQLLVQHLPALQQLNGDSVRSSNQHADSDDEHAASADYLQLSISVEEDDGSSRTVTLEFHREASVSECASIAEKFCRQHELHGEEQALLSEMRAAQTSAQKARSAGEHSLRNSPDPTNAAPKHTAGETASSSSSSAVQGGSSSRSGEQKLAAMEELRSAQLQLMQESEAMLLKVRANLIRPTCMNDSHVSNAL